MDIEATQYNMITGVKQSIFDQTGNFGFQFNINISDLTKKVNVGFTGTANLNFNFYQGKIYDNQSGFCGSYLANQNIIISGDVGPLSYDYYINGQITALGRAKSSGLINYFYVNSESGNSVNYTTDVQSIPPKYLLLNNINFYTGQNATGVFLNQEKNANFRFFSGSGNNSNINYISNSTGNIPPSGSGIYLSFISGAQAGSSYTGNYTFYTNFGNINVPVAFNAFVYSNNSTRMTLNQDNFLSLSGTTGATYSNIGPLGFQTFSGFNTINTPFLKVGLDYISGTTGNFSGGSGYNPYNRSFTGAWSLQTGIYQSTMIDYGMNGFISGNNLRNSGLFNISFNSIYIQVQYNPYPDFNIDVAQLFITGMNTGFKILITGQRI